MPVLSLPRNSKFDYPTAIELANLVERAYQDYKNAISNSSTLKIDDTTTGSQEIIELSKDGNSNKVEALPGDLSYKIVATFHELVGEKNHTPIGFIAKRNQAYYVIFRGTMEKSEWEQNFKGEQTTLHLAGKNISNNEKVSKGFQELYTKNEPQSNFKSLAEIVQDSFSNVSLSTPIFVSGHSLGGALATLATRQLLALGFKPILYSYASPRVGNPDFAAAFATSQCYRVVNSEDVVPYVPLSTLTFFGLDMGSNNHFQDRINGFVNAAKIFGLNLDVANIDDVYVHVGESIYFTDSREAISTNHNMYGTYRMALA